MDYSLLMVVKDIVEFTLRTKEKILKVFNRDMNGVGSTAEVEWEDLYSNSLWW